MPSTTRTLRAALTVVALTLALGACQTGAQTSRFQSFDTSIVRLYDLGTPDGMIELELDRTGWILEMETDVAVESLPKAVLDAARAASPGATITGAELELQQAGDFWEVKLRAAGRNIELVIDDRGTIHEIERELELSEAPTAVLNAAEKAVPDSTFKSVEVIEKGDEKEYHVKRLRDGASYKVVLGPGGVVKRAVREARAEIEIPLN